MKKVFLLFLYLSLSTTNAEVDKIVYYQPQQIHLALGEDPNSLVVTWSTWNGTETFARFGLTPSSLNLQVTGTSFIFEDGGQEKRQQYIHTANLQPLTPNTQYFYHVGSDLGWSEMFWFKTFPATCSDWSPRFAIFGDMGNDNAQSLTRLQEETQSGMYDALIHNGDFAYDMHDLDGRIGDEFMSQIQPIAAYVPYMTSPGNHEETYNFSHYKARFTMPGDLEDRMYFSYNIGPIHFISISTEYYYFVDQYGTNGAAEQFDWLIQDLKLATTSENRQAQPWVIIYGHRPMYCSDDDGDDCTFRTTATRIGLLIDGQRKYAIEPLLKEYNVDLSIWAHEHDYERFWPLFDYNVLNGSLEYPYTEPRGPVHIVSGSAGCHEGHDPWLPMKEWTAFRSADYGYTRMTAHNATHLELEQVSDDKGGEIIDHFWIITLDHDYSVQTLPTNVP